MEYQRSSEETKARFLRCTPSLRIIRKETSARVRKRVNRVRVTCRGLWLQRKSQREREREREDYDGADVCEDVTAAKREPPDASRSIKK